MKKDMRRKNLESCAMDFMSIKKAATHSMAAETKEQQSERGQNKLERILDQMIDTTEHVWEDVNEETLAGNKKSKGIKLVRKEKSKENKSKSEKKKRKSKDSTEKLTKKPKTKKSKKDH